MKLIAVGKNEQLRQAMVFSQSPIGRTFLVGSDHEPWQENTQVHIKLPFVYVVIVYDIYDEKLILRKFYALGSPTPIRSFDDPVFGLPLPNTYSNGEVCLGNNGKIIETTKEKLADKAISQFFQGVGTKLFSNLNMQLKIYNNWSGCRNIFDFYKKLAEKSPDIWDEIDPDQSISEVFTEESISEVFTEESTFF